MNAPADAILAQAAYERGRQDGIKQERAMHEHSKLSQEIEAAPQADQLEVTDGDLISSLDSDGIVCDPEAAYAIRDTVLRLAAIPKEPQAAQADQKRVEQRDHDFPILQQFHTKHALGGLAAPSCLCCGRQTHPSTRPIAVQHMELPAVVICKQCKDATSQADQSGVPSQDGWITSPDGLSRRRAAPDAAAPHVPTPSVTLRFPFGRIASQEAAPSEAMEVLEELLEVVRQKDEVERERKNEAMNTNDWMQMKIRAEAAEGKLWDRARALVSEQSPGEQAEAAYQRAKQKDNAPRTSSGQSQKGQQ